MKRRYTCFGGLWKEPNDDSCLDDIETNPDNRFRCWQNYHRGFAQSPGEYFTSDANDKRDKILRYLKCEKGLGVRQITRLTGLSYWTVYKA